MNTNSDNSEDIAMQDAAKPRDEFRDKLSETRDNITDMGHMATDAVRDKFHELKDYASSKYGEGKEKVHALEERFASTVRESPMKSVMIAAGVGLVLGWLWRRT